MNIQLQDVLFFVNYNDVNKDYMGTLNEAPVDSFLFGDDLVQRISSAKQLEEASRILKPKLPPKATQSRPQASINYNRFVK